MASRDDSDVRDVMEASRTEEMVPSSMLRAMGMKALAARDAATAAMDDLVALAAENARLVEVLGDMVEMDPYGVDSADYWCTYCAEHGETTDAIKHDPLCVWVRAEAALAGCADGGA